MNASRYRTVAELIVTFSLWGSLYVVSKYALGRVPAFTVIFARSLIASITLFFLLKMNNIRKPVKREDVKYFFAVGFGGYFLSVGLQTLGTKYATSAMASLINSLNPLTILLMSVLILHEKLTIRKVAGVAMALVGVYIILGGVGGENELLGMVLSLLSIAVWGLASTVNKRWLTQRYHPLQITAYGVAIATGFNFIPALWEWNSQTVVLDLPSIASMLYMGVFCTGVAHLLWNRCLAQADASFCSAFYPLQPMVSALLGILFLNEIFSTGFVVGSVVIVIGVLVSVREPRGAQSPRI